MEVGNRVMFELDGNNQYGTVVAKFAGVGYKIKCDNGETILIKSSLLTIVKIL